MYDFIEAVATLSFMRCALLAGLLASVACGVVGTFVVTRRITSIAGSISHFVLGGLGVAHYLKVVHGMSVEPLQGAVVAALAAALIIGFVRVHAIEREDTVISALWAVGMAIGVIFIWQTPGYHEDLMGYLFGNITMVSPSDVWLIGALDLVILAACFLFYRQFVAVCFDEEFARLRGVPVEAFYQLLLCLTALTVVLLVSVVGNIMVIALLTLPSAVAGQFSRRIWQMMALSAVLVALVTSTGLAVAYATDMPPGATIVVLAGLLYLGVSVTIRVARGAPTR